MECTISDVLYVDSLLLVKSLLFVFAQKTTIVTLNNSELGEVQASDA